MKKILALTLTVTLTGCAAITDKIPSFWDDNQSAAIVSVRQAVDTLDCQQPHALQVKVIKDQLRWFELYSESKGTKDVARLVKPMQETVNDFYKRSVEKEGSEAYCNSKKKVMEVQGKTIAEAVLGRF